ncbi:hypothetical protein A9Q99_12790 [Gammaproteobacteria bacterium 45_16_T64]|mgnify:CR=1 FL=1|nr:hypothetical protein A9Q99_12790 [Gammaproteobacteria bacterium 45_16_T64]
MIYWFDLFGTAVFALTGLLAAKDKKLDWYGGVVLAMVTAIGGGTFRDIALGRTPVFWIQDDAYFWVILSTAIIATPFISRMHSPGRWLVWSDAFGLALFNVIGCQVALASGSSLIVAVFMGMATGTFGGMIRDLLVSEIPLVLRHEIYATAALMGGIVYIALYHLPIPSGVAECLSMVTCVVIRILAINKQWSLPKLN